MVVNMSKAETSNGQSGSTLWRFWTDSKQGQNESSGVLKEASQIGTMNKRLKRGTDIQFQVFGH